MTSGRLAAVDISAGINTLIYKNPGSHSFSATINICNRNDSDVDIRLGFVDGGLADLVAADWIEYDLPVRANGTLTRSKVEMTPNQSIIGYSSKANVSFQVWA